MFYWPNLELTAYEKQFVSEYKSRRPVKDPKTGKQKIDPQTGEPVWLEKPGVLRRLYKVLLNSVPAPLVPGLETQHLEGVVQISRRARVFALTFAGDVNYWQLQISTASGEQFTPRLAGGQFPIVTAMTSGVLWNIFATDMVEPPIITLPGDISADQLAWGLHPLVIDPNWELSPNEQLIFSGAVPDPDILSVLEIGVHVWEFPGMVQGAQAPVEPVRFSGGIARGC